MMPPSFGHSLRMFAQLGREQNAPLPKQLRDEARMNRQVLAVTSLAEAETADRQCCRFRARGERLAALELSRQTRTT